MYLSRLQVAKLTQFYLMFTNISALSLRLDKSCELEEGATCEARCLQVFVIIRVHVLEGGRTVPCCDCGLLFSLSVYFRFNMETLK